MTRREINRLKIDKKIKIFKKMIVTENTTSKQKFLKVKFKKILFINSTRNEMIFSFIDIIMLLIYSKQTTYKINDENI